MYTNPFNRYRQPIKINYLNKSLPEPSQPNLNLTTPNQDIPLQLNSTIRFLTKSIFQLSDGTIIDFDTRKILKKPNQRDQITHINLNSTRSLHPTTSQIETEFTSLINSDSSVNSKLRSKIDPFCELNSADIQYWLKAEEEADKLKQNMTQDQLDMIAAFERHFPKSMLIEESKKHINQM